MLERPDVLKRLVPGGVGVWEPDPTVRPVEESPGFGIFIAA
jgi:hypothetical protein